MTIDPERYAVTQQIHTRILDYWFDVDRNWGRTAADFFTEDGVWAQERQTYNGREAVRAFYSARERRGDRVVLHAVQNFRAQYAGAPDKAIATWAWLLFGGDGVPVLPTAPPVSITYMTEQWVLIDNVWMIKHRKADALFAGGQMLGNLGLTEADGVIRHS